jgi:D-sedoheptulose 7-phosphate isomerase
LDIESIARVAVLLYEAKEKGKEHIFFFGNGGSHGIASHLACDFGKGTKINGKVWIRSSTGFMVWTIQLG